METMRIADPDRHYAIPCAFKQVRRERTIPDHIKYLNECWPKMGTEQIWEMLKIQRDDESIPIQTVIDTIGFREDYLTIMGAEVDTIDPDLMDMVPPDEMDTRRAKIRRTKIRKKGYVNVRFIDDFYLAVFGYKEIHVNRRFRSLKKACDWLDEMEVLYVHPKCVVLINYKG